MRRKIGSSIPQMVPAATVPMRVSGSIGLKGEGIDNLKFVI
jgi:hypothetical protein